MGFFGIFKKIAWPFVRIAKLFSSKAVQKVFDQVDELVPMIAPIVKSIREIVSDVKTATAQDIIRAYEKFGYTIKIIAEDPVAFGNALLNLATMITKNKWPWLPTSLIHTAIQTALMLLKAEDQKS